MLKHCLSKVHLYFSEFAFLSSRLFILQQFLHILAKGCACAFSLSHFALFLFISLLLLHQSFFLFFLFSFFFKQLFTFYISNNQSHLFVYTFFQLLISLLSLFFIVLYEMLFYMLLFLPFSIILILYDATLKKIERQVQRRGTSASDSKPTIRVRCNVCLARGRVRQLPYRS